ncbi:MAG TPA: hypothetical protein VLT47_01315 [Anaeromyxobacteraceae bacterium]|nr:hypothetical protein [Anaeromyxobacteraceae bacterium]
MRRPLIAAILALPLLGFECAGDPPADGGSPPAQLGCRFTVHGAIEEQGWCEVTGYDYSRVDATRSDFAIELAAYRDGGELAGGAGVFYDTRPTVDLSYGWEVREGPRNVDSGSASRYDAAGVTTHFALSQSGGGPAVGELHVVLKSVPVAVPAVSAAVEIHGSLAADLPSTTSGSPISLEVTF